ncbi:DNA topoisomerase VI subunit B [Candidatus Thorarchaeota archaeon]|nr:MAG: DNA topoisomerase VI subunit B [Candidatus Thorarchaeota archaeon]
MSQRAPVETRFESISPAEFFYRNQQIAGFGNSSQAMYSTVRELVENSLDSCEDAQRLPTIAVRINSDSSNIIRVRVSDNGCGVPSQYIPEAFAKVLFGSKYHQKQRRGTFGLGVTMAILYGQITTDSPVTIHTRSQDSDGIAYTLFIDVEKNQPIVKSFEDRTRETEGTTVTITLRGDLNRAQDRILEYLRLTTASSPHARISLEIDNVVKETFGRWSKIIPPPVIAAKLHPRAADLELLRRLVRSQKNKRLQDFLVDSFQRVGVRTSSQFLKFLSFDPIRQVNTLTRAELVRLSTALGKYDGFEAPESKSLSPISQQEFSNSISCIFNTSSLYYARRGPSEWQGNPFIIEGIIVSGDDFPKSDIPSLYRFANRVPLLYDSNEDVITKIVKRVNWKRYNVAPGSPVALFIHLCSTRVPYKAAGKQSISAVPEIEVELTSMLRELGRLFSKHAKKVVTAQRDSRKMREFSKTFRLLAKFSAELAGYSDIPPTSHLVKQLFEVDTYE